MPQSPKKILDVCCGSRMFWFNKKHTEAIYGDTREEEHTLCDGRELIIDPDIILDFRRLPFDSGQFALVVFDPPHLVNLGQNSWMNKKYGKLSPTWQDDIKQGFAEWFKVLKEDGVLIFKWNESQIRTSKILELSPYGPLIGHISGKRANTHWICFMKSRSNLL